MEAVLVILNCLGSQVSIMAIYLLKYKDIEADIFLLRHFSHLSH